MESVWWKLSKELDLAVMINLQFSFSSAYVVDLPILDE